MTLSVEQIQATLDEKVNPQIKLHNGFCKAVSFESGTLGIDLQGGCVGCPSSKITLFSGIMPILQENHPEIEDVFLA